MHWKNSDFGIAYFIAGNCHTPDEANRILKQIREDRVIALKSAESGYKKQQAKIIRANRVINNLDSDECDVLDAEADILELKAFEEQQMKCYKAALHEVEFIDACIAKIEPLRKYKDLPDDMACQAAQHEEWKYELIERAKDYLLTTGTIPPDHYRTMRNHPEYEKSIAPVVELLYSGIRCGQLSLTNANDFFKTLPEAYQRPMDKLLNSGAMELPKLLNSGQNEALNA